MKLADLKADVLETLSPEARTALERVVKEYGASETFDFVLALVAASTPRERQLIRILVRELDDLVAASDRGDT